jgi:hypothetical protein
VKNKAHAKQVLLLEQQKTVLARANGRLSDPTIEQKEHDTDTFIRMFSLLMVDPSPLPFITITKDAFDCMRPCWRRTLSVPKVNLTQKAQETSKEKKCGNFTRRLVIKEHQKKRSEIVEIYEQPVGHTPSQCSLHATVGSRKRFMHKN